MPWAVEAVEDYMVNVRPRYGRPGRPALWLTERGGRLRPRQIEDRFAAYRDALKCRRSSCRIACGIRT